MKENKEITPGIDFQANANARNSFSGEEIQILKEWYKEWYITRAGRVKKGKSEYSYFLANPTQILKDSFGIFKELIVLFSPYEESFQAKTLDAVDIIIEECSANRIEKICCAIISKSHKIKDEIKPFNNEAEARIYVPFHYDEFKRDMRIDNVINKRFREFLYSRDLFDITNPLKEERYFFGRSELVMDIVNAHRNFSNFGLFGLRKAGKTSIMFNVIRKLNAVDAVGVYIDCQNTDFHQNRWYDALKFVIQQLIETCNIELACNTQFTEKNATSIFEQYIRNIHKLTSKSILLFFDEIENITFGKSPSIHWANEKDFILFWQCIRHVYQKTENIFSFCILGTNPRCIEDSQILGCDNPIYSIRKPRYLDGFDIDKTKEMVQTLGNLMGMNFEDDVYTYLFRDYGGHPFLIRKICSAISFTYKTRPITIDRIIYNKVKEKFDKDNEFFKMILNVLKQFYCDEYDMIYMLANGDEQDFENFANENSDYIKHLKGYGLIKERNGKYDFQIDSIKKYLIRTNKTISPHGTKEQKWQTACTRRLFIEGELRNITKRMIRFNSKTESEAKDYIIAKLHNNKAKDYSAHTYDDLFDPSKSNMYLKDIPLLMNPHWEKYEQYFNDQEHFNLAMKTLNKEGRFDAHVNIPDETETAMINNACLYLEQGISNFNDADKPALA